MNKGSGMKPMLIDLKGSGVNTTSPEEQDETLSINTNGISALRQGHHIHLFLFFFFLFSQPYRISRRGMVAEYRASSPRQTKHGPACMSVRSIMCICVCVRAREHQGSLPTFWLFSEGWLLLVFVLSSFLLMVWEDLCNFFFLLEERGVGVFLRGKGAH